MPEVPQNTLALINFDKGIYDVSGSATVTKKSVTQNTSVVKYGNNSGFFNYENRNYLKITTTTPVKTISLWFYATGNNTANWYPTVFSTNSGVNVAGGVFMHVDDGSYSTYPVYRANDSTIAAGNNGTYGSKLITRNTWHHLAMSIDGTSFRFFIDGELQATVTQANPPEITTVGIGVLLNASNITTSGTYFSGYIDEILLNSDCLYTENFTPESEAYTIPNEVEPPEEEVEMGSETNYGSYYGTIDNITDGDENTYWWTDSNQAVGSYILFSFTKYITLNSFRVLTTRNTGDCVSSGSVLQTSKDGITWDTIGNFTGAADCSFTDLNIQQIKYVRIYAETESSKWLCINEVTMDYEEYYGYLDINLSGTWTQIKAVYKKDSTGWVLVKNPRSVLKTTDKLIRKS